MDTKDSEMNSKDCETNSKESEMSSPDPESEVVPFEEDWKQSESDLEEDSREGSIKSTPKLCLMRVRILFSLRQNHNSKQIDSYF